VETERREQAHHSFGHALRRLREAVVLRGLRATSNVESSPHPDDCSSIHGHSEVQSGNTMRMEISGTQYSSSAHEFHKTGHSVIDHRLFTKRRGMYTTPDIL
jgi:hypothetical protein